MAVTPMNSGGGGQGGQGPKGNPGEPGTGISQATITNHELILTYSDGTVANLGNVQGVQGPQGIQGVAGEHGLPGLPGAAGAAGPAGLNGAQGPAGAAGDSNIFKIAEATGVIDHNFLAGQTQDFNLINFHGDDGVLSHPIDLTGQDRYDHILQLANGYTHFIILTHEQTTRSDNEEHNQRFLQLDELEYFQYQDQLDDPFDNTGDVVIHKYPYNRAKADLIKINLTGKDIGTVTNYILSFRNEAVTGLNLGRFEVSLIDFMLNPDVAADGGGGVGGAVGTGNHVTGAEIVTVLGNQYLRISYSDGTSTDLDIADNVRDVVSVAVHGGNLVTTYSNGTVETHSLGVQTLPNAFFSESIVNTVEYLNLMKLASFGFKAYSLLTELSANEEYPKWKRHSDNAIAYAIKHFCKYKNNNGSATQNEANRLSKVGFETLKITSNIEADDSDFYERLTGQDLGKVLVKKRGWYKVIANISVVTNSLAEAPQNREVFPEMRIFATREDGSTYIFDERFNFSPVQSFAEPGDAANHIRYRESEHIATNVFLPANVKIEIQCWNRAADSDYELYLDRGGSCVLSVESEPILVPGVA